MGTPVTLNAVSYDIPALAEDNWGEDVSNYLIALSTGVLSKAGGSFTLTAESDFGANFGLKSIYYKSRGTVSTAGIMRLANDESVAWRNAANSANLELKVNASNLLEFNGNPIPTLALGAADTILQMNGAGTAYEFGLLNNANVDAAAAIAYSKLAALTASRLLVSDGSGVVSVSSVTSTEAGYLSGVTSAIQTQIDSKISSSSSDTLTNKTIDGDSNTIQDVPLTAIKTVGANTSRFITRDGSGAISDATALPTGTVVGTSDSQTLTNKTLTSPVLDGNLTGTGIVDEDDMVSDSAVKVPTQQSVKAYVDDQIASVSATGSDYSEKSADYTITDTDNVRTVAMTTGAGGKSVTLPTLADNQSRIITVYKVDSGAGTVTIDGEGSETIDGSLNYQIYVQGDSVTFQAASTEWKIIEKKLVVNGQIRLDTGNGRGSTNIYIRRFSNVTSTSGSSMTYNNSSATDGMSITITQPGIYSFSYTDGGASATDVGISLNTSAPTTRIYSIGASERLCMAYAAGGVGGNASATVRLAVGDVIRAHTTENSTSTSSFVQFVATQIARF